MPSWIDTHCHLDAPEFEGDRDAVVERARAAGVGMLVLPAVLTAHFEPLRELAHSHELAYALGTHPMYTPQADDGDIEALGAALQRWRDDPRLVAVGEIGLDFFVDALEPARQTRFYVGQLEAARDFGLPVILHVRRSADQLLKQLRRIPVCGIAHAFNGSVQQAHAFIDLGFKLGFGGAMTFDRALQLRRLAAELPLDAIVLETDAPDIPPHWLYRTAGERAAGARSRNEPAELPRIAHELAALRGIAPEALAAACRANAVAALPRLGPLLDPAG